jgi:mannitol-1-/sugar-/sorbitol-6-/2-deoxyglucose-6-phosphatase
MTEAVIFDMDGVIIDSEPLWKKAIIQIMKNHGFEFDVTMCNKTKGMRVDEVTAYWKQELNAEFDSSQAADNIVEEVIRLILDEGEEMPGLKKLLNRIQEKKLKIALASSSSIKIINSVLAKLEIGHYFEVIQSAEQEEFGKPHPAVFLTTANKLKIEPKNCLVIEDSLHGVLAGKSANMKVVAIPEIGETKLDKFIIADRIIKKLDELIF